MSSIIFQVANIIIPKATNVLHYNNMLSMSAKRSRFSPGGAATAAGHRSRSLHANDEVQTERRSGGYKPSLWDFHSIQSLDTKEESIDEQQREEILVAQVKMVLQQEQEEDGNDDRLLEMIDDLQRLGISCHFETQIIQMLTRSHLNQKLHTDLYSTALRFRLLRQHGFSVPQEVFDSFKNKEGTEFKESLKQDTKGLLQLYEASFLSTLGEETLELARKFAAEFLQKNLDDDDDDDLLSSSIRDALEIPIHWRVRMPNAKTFIEAYKRRPDMNGVVLELAQLHINIVQAQYQQELKEASRWWNSTGLVEQLPFVRDRIVECYFWSCGVLERREHGHERIIITKIVALLIVIDDIFDVYGTQQELYLFTTAIQRWDTESMKQLPPYMQLCYLALFNFVNETGYETLKEKGFNSIPYLHKVWVELVEAFMIEAKWYYSGYKPRSQEYLNNAWVSIGVLPILSDLFFRLTNPIEEETVESMHRYPHIIRTTCVITRLANDMGTKSDESKRGDVATSVECYMNEKINGMEEEAREHVTRSITEMWKTMNEEMASSGSPFCRYFLEALANMARTAQCVYQDESDGLGMQHSKVNTLLRGFLFHR